MAASAPRRAARQRGSWSMPCAAQSGSLSCCRTSPGLSRDPPKDACLARDDDAALNEIDARCRNQAVWFRARAIEEGREVPLDGASAAVESRGGEAELAGGEGGEYGASEAAPSAT